MSARKAKFFIFLAFALSLFLSIQDCHRLKKAPEAKHTDPPVVDFRYQSGECLDVTGKASWPARGDGTCHQEDKPQ